MKTNRRQRPSYGWPLLFSLLAAIALAIILNVEFSQRQSQNFGVLATGLVWLLLNVLWVCFFSRLPIRIRLSVVGVIVLFGGAVRVRGVTGDFVPILEWRWGGEAPGDALTSDDLGKGVWTATDNDYAQFLGPSRNAVLMGVGLERDWDLHPPALVWRRPVGEAWSAFSVMGRRALTQEQDGALERVTCIDLLTGELLWTHADTSRYQTTLGGIGPRATPTAAGDRVFTMGANGILNCLDLASGEVVWRRDVRLDYDAPVPMWGFSSSPLVLGHLVIVAPGSSAGASLAAYDRKTGEPVWSGGDSMAGYSSPQFATLGGLEQILIFAENQVVAHDPSTGSVLWQHVWEGTPFCISQPVPVGEDRLFVSTGYGVGGRMFQVKKNDGGMDVRLQWETPRLKAKFANVIYRDGVLYGLDDGVMTCIDAGDGSRRWKAGRYGHGQAMMVDDVMLVTTEKGEVVMLEVNPDAHVELGRFQAVEGKTWNHAALASPYLIVRNDEEAACYKLAIKPPGPGVPISPRRARLNLDSGEIELGVEGEKAR